MFIPILKYELRYWLRSPLSYLFIATVFGIALIMTLGTAGYFDAPRAMNEPIQFLNSPFGISFIYQFLWKVLSFTIPVIIGHSIFRDYQSKMHAVLYAYPITKSAYLMGKLISAMLVIFGITGFLILGLILGVKILGFNHAYIGPFGWGAYFQVAGIYLIPNIISSSLLIFTVVAWSRNIFAGFISLLLLYIFKLMVEHLFFQQPGLFALLDPFGQHAFLLTTMDWNLELQNSESLPLGNDIGYNRIFWLGCASLLFGLFYQQFDFQFNALIPRKRRAATKPARKVIGSSTPSSLGKIQEDFTWKGRWQQLFFLATYHFYRICKSWLFIGFMLFSLLAILFIEIRVTQTGAFTLLPFTRILLTAPLKVFELLVIMITFIFAGRLIHQARSNHMHLLIDASPIKNWQLIGSKLFALTFMQVLLLLFFILCGLLIQIYNGYYHFDFSQYLYHSFILLLPILFIWSVTSLMVFTIVPNLFLGLFLLIGLWLGIDMLGNLGINSWLFKINKVPSLNYSDFYAYGNSLKAYFTVQGYWLSLAGLSLVLTGLFWNRGTKAPFRKRLLLGRTRFQLSTLVLGLFFLSNFCYRALKIYHAEQALTIGSKLDNAYLEDFKKTWAPFGKIPQPSIKDIQLALDIYPDEKRFQAKGKYLLINRGLKRIDTLLIRTGFDEKTSFQWSQAVDLIVQDTAMKYAAYRLLEGINPGDTLYLDFAIESTPNTLLRRNSNVLSNGSIIKHDILPRLSYQFEALMDSSPIQHYFSSEADYILINTQISTHQSQIAIAPGTLQEQRTEGDRTIYTYQTEKPVKLNFSFHSGAYQKQEYKHAGIPIEMYALPTHPYHQEDMIAGIKAALDYHQPNFGNYPYKEIRIIEFPHTEGDFSATLTANNIPSSEMLFNLNVEPMEDKLNLPFYVMAHEITHEWFGNQLMPANVPGAKMLTESITEYLTLQIYQESLGEAMAHNFLQIQHDRYLNGRRGAAKVEQALYRAAATQDYILYGKGAIALNSIAEAIGKNRMQEILLDFFQFYQNRIDQYPRPEDFINHLKESTDIQFHPLIEELLMDLILYDHKLLASQQKDSTTIIAELEIQKINALNKQVIEDEEVIIEIGQLDQTNQLIQLDSFPLSSGRHYLELNLSPNCTQLVIDPRLLWIDQDRKNNTLSIELK